MKVAFINQPWNACPPRKGGSISIWTYEVARRVARSHDVVVYARDDGTRAAHERREGISYRRVSARADRWIERLLSRTTGVRPSGAVLGSPLHHLAYGLKVAWDLRRQRADVVHLQNMFSLAPLIRRLCRRARIVLHMHCDWLVQLPEPLVAEPLRACDLVLGCSRHVADGVRRRFPGLAAGAVANGVDPVTFRLAAECPTGAGERIAYVGRVSPEKGLHVLLEAFRRVAAARPRARLAIVGPDAPAARSVLVDLSDDPAVRALARYYDGRSYLERLRASVPRELRDRVELIGFVPHSRIAEQLADADVLVNPSLSEAFGMSLVEAMASGLPVVASAVGGMPEIVKHGVTGLIVPPDDPAPLAAALLELLASPELRMRMGRAGRAHAERHYSWETVAEHLLERYAELCGRGDGAGSRSRPGRLELIRRAPRLLPALLDAGRAEVRR